MTTVDELAEAFWRIGKVPHDPATKAWLGRVQSHTVKADGKPYKYYRSAGAGPTVLLVHGVHSYLGTMIPIADALLARGLQVVLFDAPGHGEAPGVSSDPVEISGVIRALWERIDDLRGVVAHSLGGLWTLAAARGGGPAGTIVTVASPSTMDFLVDKFVEMRSIDPDTVPALVDRLKQRVGEANWTDFSPVRIVPTLGVPGLVVHGTADDFVPPAHGEALHAAWPGSALVAVEGARHFDVLRSPEVTGAIADRLDIRARNG